MPIGDCRMPIGFYSATKLIPFLTSIKTLLASVVFEKLSYRLIGIWQLPIGNPLDAGGFRAYIVTNYER